MKKKKIFKTLLAAGVMVSSIAPSMINVYANENYIEEPEVSVRADTTAPDVSGFTVSLQPGYYDEGTVLTVRMKIVDDSPLALANLIIGPTPTGPCAGAIVPYDLVKIDDNGMYETNLTIIGCHRIRGYYIEDIYGNVTRFDFAENEYCYYSTSLLDTPFKDIDFTQWFHESVKYVYDNGLMTGLNETTFGPYENLARAQFAVILHRMNGSPDMEYTNKFPDVADNQWYTDAILWANEAGVVGGYTDTGKFGPGDNINREQMAVMMYRYANYLGYDTSASADFSKFKDAKNVNEFAKEAMTWAVGAGIITGKDNETRLDPQGSASRAECATIIMRFMEYYK